MSIIVEHPIYICILFFFDTINQFTHTHAHCFSNHYKKKEKKRKEKRKEIAMYQNFCFKLFINIFGLIFKNIFLTFK